MFIGVEFRDADGSRYFERLNVAHITRLTFVSIKNPDAGTNIHIRTGEILKTATPLDVLSEIVDETWKEAASIVMLSIINEKLSKDLLDEYSNNLDNKEA